MNDGGERVVRHSPSRGPGSPHVWGLYDPPSGSIQYVLACPATRACAIVDPVWGFDMRAARTDTAAMEQVLALVAAEGLAVEWVLDTHPHADHFTASALLAERTGARTAIGGRCAQVAELWEGFYARDLALGYDRLWSDGETFALGDLTVRVMLTPGHTLASVAYVAGDAACIHDTLMQPDSGTSRCDFPGGSAADLWASIERILALPDATRLFVGHDYRPGGREPRWEASVEEQRDNIHLEGRTREEWIALREARDATLPLPERMLAALQVNLAGGRLPKLNGQDMLSLPVNRF